MNEDDKPTPDITDDHKQGQDDGKPEPGDSGPIRFTVNDVELVSNHDRVVALDILRMAKEKGAFEGDPENYYLEAASDDKRYQPEDWVELKQNEKLLTIPRGPTQVACA